MFIEYKDLTFGREEPTLAAEAAACAVDQNAYWRFNDGLFENQLSSNQESFSRSRVEAMAEALELDMSDFNQCLDDGEKTGVIQAMQQESLELGINSTPTVVVNGEVLPYNGYADLKAKIESELAAQ